MRSPLELVSMLNRCGLIKIGEGSYAEVYAKKTKDFAYKVGNMYLDENDGWFQYAKLAKKHSANNPYFPEISFIRGSARAYIAKMEFIPKTLFDIRDGVYNKSYEIDDSLWQVFYEDKNSTLVQKLYEQNPEFFKFLKDEKFWEAVSLIKEYMKDFPDMDLDIHDRNIMIRENGQIVITDPYLEGY